MALKDLVAQKAALTEEAIERIVEDYVRYDTEAMEILLTPEAVNLGNREKVLVYVTALQGWAFVTDENVPMDVKPAELEESLNIAGGTLRPILKDLKDKHLLTERGGRYSVRASGMATIEKALSGGKDSTVQKRKTRPKKQKVKGNSPDIPEQNKNKSAKGPSAGNKGAGEKFKSWIDEGFFDQPRTGKDVQDRFHREAIIIPRTSIPGHLLKAVRNGKLVREKAKVNEKMVWVYKSRP